MATAQQIQAHYDVDNDFYRLFLDRDYRVYSCGVWADAETLEQAQINKLQRMAGFANLSPGAAVLDIGCGWGGMMRYATETCAAREAVGLTLSQAQLSYVLELSLPKLAVHLQSWADYENPGYFDAVVSIGAFEHFASLQDRRDGRQLDIYRNFFRRCLSVSKPNAMLGLQTIVTARMPNTRQSVQDARYLLGSIFHGTALPWVHEIRQAAEGLYEEVDAKMIGADYGRTLQHWQWRLESQRAAVVTSYGDELFQRYQRYFEAARRSFDGGYIDLRQMSFRPVKRN
jgi:cyclopropane-fatty-acyl-phospholipid synthase